MWLSRRDANLLVTIIYPVVYLFKRFGIVKRVLKHCVSEYDSATF